MPPRIQALWAVWAVLALAALAHAADVPGEKVEAGSSVVRADDDGAPEGAAAGADKPKPNPILSAILSIATPLIAQVVYYSPMEAMRKIRAEGTTGTMTAIPYSAMMTSCSIWITYGLLAGDPTIWVPNCTGAMFGAYYIYIYRKYTPVGVSLLPHYLAVGGSFVAAFIILMALPQAQALPLVGYIGVVLVVIMFSGPLAVIQTVIKTKSTASLPPFFTAASFCNCFVWTCYGGLIINDPFIWGPNLAGLIATLVQISLFFVYGMPPPALPTHTELKQSAV